MKQKDLALVIIIAAISGGVSFAVSHFLFLTPQNRSQTVALVDKITTDFPTPDPKFFNSNSINPAKLIEIQNNTNNTNPFNGSPGSSH